MYLFTDNEARAVIYNNKSVMPGAMFVQISTLDDDETTLVPCPMFVQQVSISRRAKVQIDQTLDQKYHHIGFGEHPSDIRIKGLAILPSQGTPSKDSARSDSVQTVHESTIKRLKAMGVKSAQYQAAKIKDATKTGKSGGGKDDSTVFDRFMSRLAASTAVGAVTGATGAVTGALNKVREVFDDVANATNSVGQVIQFVTNIKSNAYKALYAALGMPTAGGEKLAELNPDDFRIGTTHNLHAFFHAYNAGYFKDASISVVASGINFEARLVGLDMDSGKGGSPFYTFTMHFKAFAINDAGVLAGAGNYMGVPVGAEFDPDTYVDLNSGSGPFSDLLMTGLDLGFEALGTKEPLLF